MELLEGAILPERAIVAVSGPQALEFLQGIVTADVDDVRRGAARNAALLTPQGKILFEFIIMPTGDDGFMLDTPKSLSTDLVKRLMFYRLRAKVDISERNDLVVAAFWGPEEGPRLEGAVRDPRLPALGWRVIMPADDAEARLAAAGATLLPASAYDVRRIARGVAELGADYASGQIFPHEADLDQLAGVDFDKGCFVGQEVVSRMQHRGTARKRFLPVAVEGVLPALGAEVRAGERLVGETGSAAGGYALALLRLDRLADAFAEGQRIQAEGASLKPLRPEWARFEWPGGSGS